MTTCLAIYVDPFFAWFMNMLFFVPPPQHFFDVSIQPSVVSILQGPLIPYSRTLYKCSLTNGDASFISWCMVCQVVQILSVPVFVGPGQLNGRAPCNLVYCYITLNCMLYNFLKDCTVELMTLLRFLFFKFFEIMSWLSRISLCVVQLQLPIMLASYIMCLIMWSRWNQLQYVDTQSYISCVPMACWYVLCFNEVFKGKTAVLMVWIHALMHSHAIRGWWEDSSEGDGEDSFDQLTWLATQYCLKYM
jgi:hypothetical protein